MVATNEIDWYSMVPKDFAANLRFRRKVRKWGLQSDENAEQLWLACSRDLLFWVNAFVWTYDASGTYGTSGKPTMLPFITYDYQDRGFLEIDAAISDHDLLFEKSRDMGASYMALTTFTWHFDFHPMHSFLMVSRNENLVDKPNDPKSLFWKIDSIHKHLPGFLCPSGVQRDEKNRTKLHIHNEANGSTIDGESTTGDVGRGDRRAGVLLDEFAAFERDDGYKALSATQSVSKCRIFNSTPQGVGNAFYDTAQLKAIKKLRLHWTECPWKRRGLYTATKDSNPKAKLLDEGFDHPPKYAFILDGKVRSPWYDAECARSPIETLIRQELDIDYLGSGAQFFSAAELAKVETDYVQPPCMVGDLEFEQPQKPKGFVEALKGRLALWMRPDADGNPARDRKYCLGVDISEGTGASNSVIEIGDKKTGEKVGEFVTPHLRPDQLAEYAVAVAAWFKGDDGGPAFMIWESNGPGRSFGDRVMELGHRNVFYREKEDSVVKKKSTFPGWHSTKDGKKVLLREYGRAITTGEFIERSHDTVVECASFIFLTDGSIGHVKAQLALDPSGAKDNHGDRVTATAVWWRGMREVVIKKESTKPVILPGSMAWRIRERKQAERKTELLFA